MGLLVRDLLRRSEVPGASDLGLSMQAGRWLLSQRWALNIRELVQSLAAAIALGDGGQIRLEHLPAAIREYEAPRTPVMTPHDRMLRERLVQLLREAGGNIAAVGRAMERAPIQIRRWCHRLNIDLRQFRH